MALQVHTHPAFSQLLEDVALNKGERLLLACAATGTPPPTITWAFNNNIIPGKLDGTEFISTSAQSTYTETELLVYSYNLCATLIQ